MTPLLRTTLTALALFMMSTASYAHCGKCGEKDNHKKVNDYKKAYCEKHDDKKYKIIKEVGHLGKGQTAQLQRRLNSNGFDITVDGIWGDETSAALKAYQRKNNLTVTGDLDPETQRSMNLVLY